MAVNTINYDIDSDSTSVSRTLSMENPLPNILFDGIQEIWYRVCEPFVKVITPKILEQEEYVITKTKEFVLQNEYFDRFVDLIESTEELENSGLNHLFNSFN